MAAPCGYIARTNFSFSGKMNEGAGYVRFMQEDKVLMPASASSVVVQGIRAGENPELTTMWTILGYPPTSVAMPVWLKRADTSLPKLLMRDQTTNVSSLCNWSILLAGRVFAYKQGMGSNRYMNWEKLYNEQRTGYMQQLAPVEQVLFYQTQLLLQSWRAKGSIDYKEMQELYNEQEALVGSSFDSLVSAEQMGE